MADEPDPPSEHDLKVRGWRVSQFERMGFDGVQAEFLADSKADLHEAARMLTEGCPIEIAYSILAD